jgi:hypothetical protein
LEILRQQFDYGWFRLRRWQVFKQMIEVGFQFQVIRLGCLDQAIECGAGPSIY